MIRLRFNKKQTSSTTNMLWISFLFSFFYWVMESVRDVIVFKKGKTNKDTLVIPLHSGIGVEYGKSEKVLNEQFAIVKLSGDKISFVVIGTFGRRERKMTYTGTITGSETISTCTRKVWSFWPDSFCSWLRVKPDRVHRNSSAATNAELGYLDTRIERPSSSL